MRSKKIIAIIMSAIAVIVAATVTIVCLTHKYADGLDRAITLAMSDAKCSTEYIDDYSSSIAFKEGIVVYTVDFTCNGFEHKYVINSLNDKIISKERKPYASSLPSETTTQFSEINISETETSSQAFADTTDSTNDVTPTSNTATSANATSSIVTAAEPPTTEATTMMPSVSTYESYPQSEYIGIDKAKEIALAKAGVDSSTVIFTKAKLDREHGIRIYKIEFEDAVTEYEFEIHAVSGMILEYSKEPVDD
ncbi:MAG: PepSY domain-containing protein [Faecalibacterium sp.]|nr:PepSY domain-containing protein [Ruminococcus sp.]MCM1392606.1 PepSY domain-containing protein [Ruminococcus sp.]MCM1486527.1 PepSY domain-containing protein [Faecalibacterium sp.]